jgi:hypothetical protein
MARKRGITYPLTVVNGQLGYSEDLALVEEHIISVLETRPYERVMRATYGFDPKIFDTLEPNAINARIYKAVTSEVQEVEDLDVQGSVNTEEEGMYQVTLYYKVQGIPAPPLTLSLNM